MSGHVDRPGHRVLFYRHRADVVDACRDVLRPVLDGGGTAVLLADRSLRRLLSRSLQAEGEPPCPRRCIEAGVWATHWGLRLLRRWNEPGLTRWVENVMTRAAGRGNGQIAVVSELGGQLWGRGRHEESLLVERIWGQRNQQQPFAMLCLFRLDDGAQPPSVLDVHDEVVHH